MSIVDEVYCFNKRIGRKKKKYNKRTGMLWEGKRGWGRGPTIGLGWCDALVSQLVALATFHEASSCAIVVLVKVMTAVMILAASVAAAFGCHSLALELVSVHCWGLSHLSSPCAALSLTATGACRLLVNQFPFLRSRNGM